MLAQSGERHDQLRAYNEMSIIDDPHPYFEHLRSQAPVQKLPYYDVYAVTGCAM